MTTPKTRTSSGVTPLTTNLAHSRLVHTVPPTSATRPSHSIRQITASPDMPSSCDTTQYLLLLENIQRTQCKFVTRYSAHQSNPVGLSGDNVNRASTIQRRRRRCTRHDVQITTDVLLNSAAVVQKYFLLISMY